VITALPCNDNQVGHFAQGLLIGESEVRKSLEVVRLEEKCPLNRLAPNGGLFGS
jgi:hypothetical protein